jgi:hypothetical protein
LGLGLGFLGFNFKVLGLVLGIKVNTLKFEGLGLRVNVRVFRSEI